MSIFHLTPKQLAQDWMVFASGCGLSCRGPAAIRSAILQNRRARRFNRLFNFLLPWNGLDRKNQAPKDCWIHSSIAEIKPFYGEVNFAEALYIYELIFHLIVWCHLRVSISIISSSKKQLKEIERLILEHPVLSERLFLGQINILADPASIISLEGITLFSPAISPKDAQNNRQWLDLIEQIQRKRKSNHRLIIVGHQDLLLKNMATLSEPVFSSFKEHLVFLHAGEEEEPDLKRADQARNNGFYRQLLADLRREKLSVGIGDCPQKNQTFLFLIKQNKRLDIIINRCAGAKLRQEEVEIFSLCEKVDIIYLSEEDIVYNRSLCVAKIANWYNSPY